jgi:hypothetical protein
MQAGGTQVLCLSKLGKVQLVVVTTAHSSIPSRGINKPELMSYTASLPASN